MSHDFPPGSVWLVGAGPGDPDLLTRKAERLIVAADIVFYDALVGPGILALIPPGTEQVGVGKRSGRHSKDQVSINVLLANAALAGKRVVRLKGGDPSIFGRSTEELDHLAVNGITVRICPGITAASAAAASGGASLTLRGLARKLTFVTAHARAGEALDLDWTALAAHDATLAVYMGRAAAGDVARNLIAAGRAPDTPVMVAVNVSLPTERILRGRLSALAFLVETISDNDPSLLLIGEATAGSSIACSASDGADWQLGVQPAGANQLILIPSDAACSELEQVLTRKDSDNLSRIARDDRHAADAKFDDHVGHTSDRRIGIRTEQKASDEVLVSDTSMPGCIVRHCNASVRDARLSTRPASSATG